MSIEEHDDALTDAQVLDKLQTALNSARAARLANDENEFWASLEDLRDILDEIMGDD